MTFVLMETKSASLGTSCFTLFLIGRYHTDNEKQDLILMEIVLTEGRILTQ